jgi:predicted ester cyclase
MASAANRAVAPAPAAGAAESPEVRRTRITGENYFAAWVARDLERIMALHTADPAFVLHGADGVQEWKGTAAVRQIFDAILKAFPDQTFDVKSLLVRDGLLVAHSIVSGTLATPWPIAGRTYLPNGRKLQFEIVDIWHIDGDRVRTKEGWLDAMALHNKLGG